MILIDNINSRLGDDLKATLDQGTRLRIAAASFSIYAYEALKKELEAVESVEFLFTDPAFTEETATDPIHKEVREFHIPKALRERELIGGEFEIRLRNQLTQKAIARECAEWIRRKASFKSNVSESSMQSFAVASASRASVAYFPLNGFTAVSLGIRRGNSISNFVSRTDDASQVAQFLSLFQQVWQDPNRTKDVTKNLADYIATVYRENSPQRIYFFILYNIFHEFLQDMDSDALPNERTGYQESLIWKKLFNFQRDGAIGIINRLEEHNGCILADSVGLGKTFTALAVIKYYELRNKSVLVLCPKKLSDNWTNYKGNLRTNPFVKDRFNYDVLCHTDLQRQRGSSLGIQLDRINWGNYDLVVIDESHNFRNNNSFKDRETRYQTLLRKVMQEGVHTKVLMLSATPVNNRFQDLYNQLLLAWEGKDADLGGSLAGKELSLVFRDAQAAFNRWSKLPAGERTASAILETLSFDFFEMLDKVTIARSRRHVQSFYDTSDIGSFPQRCKPISLRAPLTKRTDVLPFGEIFEQLMTLRLSIYAPLSFVVPSRRKRYEELYDTRVSSGGGTLRQADREKSLQRLMTTNLLKRLESSVAAFRLTLSAILQNHKRLLETIEAYELGKGADEADLPAPLAESEFDEDDLDEAGETVGNKVRIRLADMDLPSWKRDLEADLAVLIGLESDMEKVAPEYDVKLRMLKDLIAKKVREPLNPGNRKVLVFSAFADTARYLYQHLAPWLQEEFGLATGLVLGSDDPRSTLRPMDPRRRGGFGFQEILALFSPLSKAKADSMPEECGEIDLLIATDCISEGQNLQDCDWCVNYDIHWNPVRIVQRFGRVDRIGSRNSKIQLVNFWPDISLDAYIHLKERVESRMVIADMVATGDDNVLTAGAEDIAYRKEQLRRLQEEVIELEDLRTGVNITDLGLNEFRMDLLGYVKECGDPGQLPTGLHAVVPADPERGLPPGILFVLRNRNRGVDPARRNRLHPFYMVYVGADGEVVADHLQAKRLLDLLRLACRERSEPLPEAFEAFNRRTRDGRDMEEPSRRLDDAVFSLLRREEDDALDSLFTGERTSALGGSHGLDDFELVAFLVVEDTRA